MFWKSVHWKVCHIKGNKDFQFCISDIYDREWVEWKFRLPLFMAGRSKTTYMQIYFAFRILWLVLQFSDIHVVIPSSHRTVFPGEFFFLFFKPKLYHQALCFSSQWVKKMLHLNSSQKVKFSLPLFIYAIVFVLALFKRSTCRRKLDW